jgi:serine/threonine-protein kinase
LTVARPVQEKLVRVGRYRLLRAIGRGGTGDVHLARLESSGGVNRLAAVKIVRPELADERQREALLAEARLCALVSHPNVVQLFDADVEQGTPWFAMEFVPGLSLAELSEAGAKVPPWIAARMVATLCRAVHGVHCATDERGNALAIVHRDITPHNVLVSWNGIVKLADFGIARSAIQSSWTQDGVVKGKLAYMSPEQANGRLVDARSDVFAIGIVLWELLAGRRLFERSTRAETLAAVVACRIPSLSEIDSSVPPALVRIAERALRAQPAARPESALTLERALERALSDAGFVLGENDIAAFLAAAVPGRVREHERFIDRPCGSDAPAAPARDDTLPSTRDGIATKAGNMIGKWALRTALAGGGVVVAVALLAHRPAGGGRVSSSRDADRPTGVPSLVLGGSPSAAPLPVFTAEPAGSLAAPVESVVRLRPLGKGDRGRRARVHAPKGAAQPSASASSAERPLGVQGNPAFDDRE